MFHFVAQSGMMQNLCLKMSEKSKSMIWSLFLMPHEKKTSFYLILICNVFLNISKCCFSKLIFQKNKYADEYIEKIYPKTDSNDISRVSISAVKKTHIVCYIYNFKFSCSNV